MKRYSILLMLVASALTVNAQIIYQEDFDGDTSDLNGTAPNIAPGSEVWQGASSFKQDGSISGGDSSIFLPLTLDVNTTYELTLGFDMTLNNGSTSWFALGFSSDAATPSTRNFANTGTDSRDWFLVRQNGNTVAFGGIAATNKWFDSGSTAPGPVAIGTGMQMTTTLTTGATLADSSISMAVIDANSATYVLDLDDGSAATSRNVDASSLTYIGISEIAVVGSLNSFTFAAIPEPSTYALLASLLGLAVITLRRRRNY
ncbi:PEP-CTERM sorting domain-containing protein [Rubellicoccus peritrichatus]|uniref:PEP-CTERM sorting domain-containing protein n=1 Tax=Rubellicoccus peritrichatus TaxID=3080537 RepID=A0AAQ3QSQ2_9BACT|nr:PEP-CTERM sorting domain-containing protein [Puniceicoccus sp. CR14]WOO42773.1 PEP-CTERM sorting domain-containing protein [Puniceicoccus sp. CR14]